MFGMYHNNLVRTGLTGLGDLRVVRSSFASATALLFVKCRSEMFYGWLVRSAANELEFRVSAFGSADILPARLIFAVHRKNCRQDAGATTS